jgi:hypothetical protein
MGSSYTTTIWERMKDNNNFIPAPIPELIEKFRPVLFDYDYQTPTRMDKEDFKKWFETAFISKYMTNEIGFDTFEEFHIKLFGYMQSKMSYYSTALDNLLAVTPDKAFVSGKWGTTNIHSEDEYTNKSKSNNNTDSMGSTLPINMIGSNAISNVKYADSANKNESTGNTESNNKGTRQHDESYDVIYTYHIEKLIGYNKEYKKWYDSLFDEFEILFLGVM